MLTKLVVLLAAVQTATAPPQTRTECYDCNHVRHEACEETRDCGVGQDLCITTISNPHSGDTNVIRKCARHTECDAKCDGDCSANTPCCHCCEGDNCNDPLNNSIKTCATVANPVGGFTTCSTGTFNNGAQCFLYCVDDGYELNGEDTFTCDGLTGNWLPPPGTCAPISDAATCDSITVVGGTTNCSATPKHGDICQISCHLSKIVNGNDIATCDNGVWTPTVGTCVESEEFSRIANRCYDCDASPVEICENVSPCTTSQGRCYASTKLRNGVYTYKKKCARAELCSEEIGDMNCVLGDEYTCVICCQTNKCNYDNPTPISATCDSIPDPIGGVSSCNDVTTSVGEFCSVTCTAPYTLASNGNDEVECLLDTGDWADTLGPCYTTCGPYSTSDGSTTCDTGTFNNGDQCTITCDGGFTLNGAGTVTCDGLTGNWLPTPATCVSASATCTGIAAPVNGASTCEADGQAVTTSCDITCDSGYSLSAGTSTVTCDGLNTWSDGTTPLCSVTACVSLNPTNGGSSCESGTTASGQTCTVTCDSGFSLTVGTETVTCEDSMDSAGEWNDPTTPVCSATACVSLNPTNGGSSCESGTTASGQTCTVTCDSGFSLTAGTETVTCEDSMDSAGEWDDPTTPVCSATACVSLNPTDGGSSCESGTTVSGQTCTVTCDSGFSLTAGTETVTCEDSMDSAGEWDDSTVHTCTATACSAISAPANGASSCSGGTTASGAQCTITCDGGYSLTAGIATVTCNDAVGSAGEWSDTTAHACTDATTTCGAIAAPANGASTCESAGNAVAATCQITCDSGYSLSVGTASVTCEASGQWSDTTTPTCTVTACPAIDPANGGSDCSGGTTASGEDCTVTCDSGFSLTAGTETVTCEDSTDSAGEWDDPTTHVCSATACVSLNPTNGGSSCESGTTASGQTCTVTCDSGFSLTAGTETVTCEDSMDSAGEWDDPTTPVCSATACVSLNPTDGGSSCESGTTASGQTCTVTCDSGFSLTAGTETVTCEDSMDSAGEWDDPTTPVCSATACAAIPAPSDGGSDCSGGTTASGVDCTITCDTGFSLTAGSETYTCEDSMDSAGEWDDSTSPVCSATVCGAIPAPVNGASDCSGGPSTTDDTCSITCDSGYSLTSGTALLTCEDSMDSAGEWDGSTSPVCSSDSAPNTCYKCDSVADEADCTEEQTCHEGDWGSCMSEVEFIGAQRIVITKRCKQRSACELDEDGHALYHCYTSQPGNRYKCQICCFTTNCNVGLPVPTDHVVQYEVRYLFLKFEIEKEEFVDLRLPKRDFATRPTTTIEAPNAPGVALPFDPFFHDSILKCVYCEDQLSMDLCDTSVQFCTPETIGCQTVVHKVEGERRIHKSCRDYAECLNDKYNLEHLCTGGDNSVCFDCCYKNFCNQYHFD